MVAPPQEPSSLRWDEVRLFLALYRKRSLSAAGASVGLDASTLSRRLVALEELLGTHLFDRTREGLVPTEAAELLLPAAEEMALAHARFVQDAVSFERLATGSVRLSVPPGLAEAFVAPALPALLRKYPGIRIELDAQVRFTDLTRREADIAIRTRRPQSGDLVCVKLGERRWTPMTAKRSRHAKEALADWNAVPWITWGDDMQEFAPAQWLRKHAPSANYALCTSHISSQLSAVEAGLGVALLPPALAQNAAITALAVAPALDTSMLELPTTETWLVGHRALRSVPRVAAVWEFLHAALVRFETAAETTIR